VVCFLLEDSLSADLCSLLLQSRGGMPNFKQVESRGEIPGLAMSEKSVAEGIVHWP
jgi:hypothetical protein